MGSLAYAVNLSRKKESVSIPVNENDERLENPQVMGTLLLKLRETTRKGELSQQVLDTHICISEDHRGTMHHRVPKKCLLTQKQTTELHDYLEGLGLHRDVDHRHSVYLWKKCLLNDTESPQGLYRAYVRSTLYESSTARDATHIKFETAVESADESQQLKREVRFGRVQFFMEHTSRARAAAGEPDKLLLAYVEEILAAKEVSTGRALYKVAGASKPRLTRVKRPMNYVINIDDILGLIGLVVAGKEKYFTEKDTCFL